MALQDQRKPAQVRAQECPNAAITTMPKKQGERYRASCLNVAVGVDISPLYELTLSKFSRISSIVTRTVKLALTLKTPYIQKLIW